MKVAWGSRASGLGCVSQPRGPWSGRWGQAWSGRVLTLLPRQASSSATGPLGRNVSPALRLTPFFFFSGKQNKIRMREEEGTGGSGDNLHKDGNRREIEGRRAGHVLASVGFGGQRGGRKKRVHGRASGTCSPVRWHVWQARHRGKGPPSRPALRGKEGPATATSVLSHFRNIEHR